MIRFIAALAAVAAAAAPLGAQIPQAEYAARRDSVLDRVGDGVVLALGAPEPEHDYISFFQHPELLYLTGVREPEIALVMVRRGTDRTSIIFVEERTPAEEVWSGVRLGAAGAARRTGMRGRDVADLPAVVDSLLALGLPLHVAGDTDRREGPGSDRPVVARLTERRPGTEVRSAADQLDALRRVKSAAELDLLRRAIAITVDAQREAMRLIEPGMNEFEAQALIEYTFRRNGADRPGFASIVGSGPNATTLHYNANDRFMSAGDVVVMDVGASYRGYSADVTRTVPVSGTFTTEQREIYRIVRDAQAAAERAAAPGVSFGDLQRAASRVLAEGLTRAGLIERPDATYECRPGERCPQLSLYFMHGIGHDIGLEVHDPQSTVLVPGTAFTIEPGIYVRGNTLALIPDTPANRGYRDRLRGLIDRYANIGVRIEDDYFVTPGGVEWISRAPREIAEIEALMREPYAGPAPRDPVKVDWYRRSGDREDR